MGLNWVFLLFFWMQFEAVTMETVCAWVGGCCFQGLGHAPVRSAQARASEPEQELARLRAGLPRRGAMPL